jgi:hypothetical protein
MEKDESNISSVVARVFVAVVMYLPGRCLAKIEGNTDTETNWRDGLRCHGIKSKFNRNWFRHW